MKKPGIPRRALWIVGGLVALNLAPLGGCFLAKWIPAGKVIERERLRVQRELAALRAERVMRPAFFEPAEDGNSWELLAQALLEIEKLSEEELAVFPAFRDTEFLGGEITEPGPEVRAAVIAKVEPQFEVLGRALRRRRVEPAYPYEQGLAMKLPLIAPSIKAARILRQRAITLHQERKNSEAVDRLIVGFGMGDHMAVKGSLVNELVRIVLDHTMADALKAILADHRLASADLARLERVLATLEANRPPMIEAYLRDDVLAAFNLIDMVDGNNRNALEPGMTLNPYYFFSFRIMAADYFDRKAEFNRAIQSAVRLPRAQRKTEFDRLHLQMVEEKKNLLLRLIVPSLVRAWKSHDEDVQEISLARIAVALARHREEAGTFPKSMGDLTPKYLPTVPGDEIGGRPFSLVVEGDLARVYAWGEDGDDDGGRPIDESDGVVSDGADGDIVWTIKRK